MEILEYLDKLNWQTIIGMFVICWYFTYDIKIALKSLDEDMKAQGARTDKLYEMFCSLQNQMKDEILEMKKEQYQFMKENSKSVTK